MTTLTVLNSDLIDGAIPSSKYAASTDTYVVFESGSTCTAILNNAFAQMPNLTTITFPSGIISIGAAAFLQCSKLTNVTLPNELTTIGERCFADCIALTYISIPPNVSFVGSTAFINCQGLKYINLNNSTRFTTLTPSCFQNCSNTLNGIVIPDNIVDICNQAFKANGLISVYFGENSACRTIGSSAFQQCPLLKSIILPNSLTSIYNLAFEGCAALSSIVIPPNVSFIGNNAFYNLPSHPSIYFTGPPPSGTGNIVDTNDTIIQGYISQTMADGSWSQYITSGYRGLKIQVSTDIPPIWSLGDIAIKTTNASGNILVSWENTLGLFATYTIIDETGNSYANQSTPIQSGPTKYTSTILGLTEGYHIFTVKATIQPQGWIVFSRSILYNIVYETPNLLVIRNVDLSNGVLLFSRFSVVPPPDIEYIEFELPSLCTRIDDQVFQQWMSLKHITFPPTLQYLGDQTLKQCPLLTNFDLPDSLLSIGLACFSDLPLLTYVSFPPNIESIGERAFIGCNGITHVDMTRCTNLTSIRYQAFNGMTPADTSSNMKCIIIPDSLLDICSEAFRNAGLTCVYFGENSQCKSIERQVFFQCPSLKIVVLSNTLESIGDLAFCDCGSLTTLIIPSSVKYVGSGAFVNMGLSEYLTIGANASIYFECDPPDGPIDDNGITALVGNGSTWIKGYISQSMADGSWSQYITDPSAGTGVYRGLNIQVSTTRPPVWNGGNVSVVYEPNPSNPKTMNAVVSWNPTPASSYSVVNEEGIAYPFQTDPILVNGRLQSTVSNLPQGYNIFTVAAVLLDIPWNFRPNTINPRADPPGIRVLARAILRLGENTVPPPTVSPPTVSPLTDATFPVFVGGYCYSTSTTYLFDMKEVSGFLNNTRSSTIQGVVPPVTTNLKDMGRRLFAFGKNNLKTHELREVQRNDTLESYYICVWTARGIAPTYLTYGG
jgi:hypothetical protein